MKIFIQSKPNIYSAYGLNKMTDPTSGLSLQKTKYGRSSDALRALYSGKVGGLLNGLSYKPWLDENGKQKVDSDGRKLTWQDREEQRWNKPTGYLTNRSWRKGDSLNEQDMPYFQKNKWRLQDGTTVLDVDNNFDDAMFYYVALDSKLIANSEKELMSRVWPHATHFISLTNESDEIAYNKKRRKAKALNSLESKELTALWKERFTHILGLSSVFNSVTDEQIFNLLYDFIEADNGREGHNISKFTNLASLLKTDEGRKTLDARHLLQKALTTRVVYEKSDTYTWNRSQGPIILGDRYEDAIAFLLNPSKDTLVEELEAEIRSKLI